MDTINVDITDEMHEALNSLASNLYQSEPFILYTQAIQALEADPQASSLLNRLAQAQNDVRNRQIQSSISPADIENLRSLQREAQANEIILNFSKTQQAAVTYIREINQEISLLLGVDFGALARRSCC